MGVMIEGVWHVNEPPREADGKFRRTESPLRSWITPDGSPGPSGDGGYKAEAGRYHLYVAETCPWAHRAWIFRILKGLEEAVPMSILLPRRNDQGWIFSADDERYRDKQNGVTALQELYLESHPKYTGRITVPVLWDTQTRTIVSNESSEIIRMFNSAFADVAGNDTDYYPAALRGEIDAVNARVYDGLNNGVYRAGFAHTQKAYEDAFDEVFATLDWLEARLSAHRYLAGDRITEADWRAFPTLVRFDVAYVGAFRCNLRRLVDYPNLWALTRELYQQPGIAATVWPEIYKRGYFRARAEHGTTEIIPKGPAIDFAAPILSDERARAAAE
jgi:putative glutathione S-transferase